MREGVLVLRVGHLVVFFSHLEHDGCRKWCEKRVGWQMYALVGHASAVRFLAFSLDGTRIVRVRLPSSAFPRTTAQ